MIVMSECGNCKRLRVDKENYVAYCEAYPKGIPNEWLLNGRPEKVKECNNGIGYDPESVLAHSASN